MVMQGIDENAISIYLDTENDSSLVQYTYSLTIPNVIEKPAENHANII